MDNDSYAENKGGKYVGSRKGQSISHGRSEDMQIVVRMSGLQVHIADRPYSTGRSAVPGAIDVQRSYQRQTFTLT